MSRRVRPAALGAALGLAVSLVLTGTTGGLWLARLQKCPDGDAAAVALGGVPANSSSRAPCPFLPRIPRVVHHVFGLAPDFSGTPFNALHAASILSARRHLRPTQALFHHTFEPSGPLWDLVKPHLTLVTVANFSHIFDRPVDVVAHKADWVRLNALLEHGGVYLDMDTIVLRDMDEFLELDALSSSSLRSPDPSAPAACEKTHQFVIAKEGTWGAANAVMLSARNATFLRAWRLLYQFFNDSVWADHSVYQPRKLAEQLPEQVTLLEQGAFLDPLFGPQDLDRVYAKGSAHDWPRWQYAYHGWESRAAARYNFSEIFEPRYVMKVDSAINRLVRPYMEELVGQGLKVG